MFSQILRSAQDRPILVELINGQTYNGHLISSDEYMNLQLRQVICTSRDGDNFWSSSESFITGNSVKFLIIPGEVTKVDENLTSNEGFSLATRERGRGGRSHLPSRF